MKDCFYLIPIALGLGLSALAAFMWSLKTGNMTIWKEQPCASCRKRTTNEG